MYPDYWSIGGAMDFYESYLYPRMAKNQSTVIIPPMYADAANASRLTAIGDCDDANCTRAMLTWAEATFAWAQQDPRVVALTPFHWSTSPTCKGAMQRCVGGKSIPAVRDAWEAIGKQILAAASG